MMNGREKSDPAIVAVKPTNKAERSGGGAGGAKGGDRGERGTGRARSGRRAGKAWHTGWTAYGKPQRQRKKEKFTALLHHVNVDPLERRSST